MPAPWRAEPVLMAAAAVAFGTLGDHARAIACRPAITRAERSAVPLDTLEQLAGFTIARAGELARTAARSAQAARLLAEAGTLLQALLAIGRTAHRCSLLGSLHRSRALMARDGRRRRQAIEAMAEAYGDSVRLAAAAPRARVQQHHEDGVWAEARAERLAALAVLCWWPGRASVQARLTRQIQAGLAELRALPGTSRAQTRPDYLLIDALINGALMGGPLMHEALTVRRRRQLLQALRRPINGTGVSCPALGGGASRVHRGNDPRAAEPTRGRGAPPAP